MRRFGLLALLGMALACGGDKSTGPGASIAGNYTLRTVNGNNIPAVAFQNAGVKAELTDGFITLGAGNSWFGSLTARETDLTTGSVSTVVVPAIGTYTANNGSLTLTNSVDGSNLPGTVSNGALTINGNLGIGAVVTLVFRQ